MTSVSFPLAAGLSVVIATSLLGGCAGETAEEQAKFPQAPGSDAFNASEGQEEQAEEVAAPGAGVVGPDGQVGPAGDSYADTDPSALTDFHSALDPHGTWIDDPTYGTMWQPSPTEVGPDFAPYVSDGQWAYDDANQYVWMSNYGWGWAPFHYGRWAYGGSGWGWIPGRAYAPAWVSWRTGAPGFGYVGWAPMAPSYYWGPGGVAFGLAAIPPTPYAFVGVHDLFTPNGLQNRVVSSPTQMQAIAGQTHSYVASGSSSPHSPAASGGRVPATPSISGPTPQSLHLSNSEVNHVAANNPQLSHAVQFSRPSTAMAMGAHAPAGSAMTSRAGLGGARAASASMPGGAVAGHAENVRPSMPAYGGGIARGSYSNQAQFPSTRIGDNYYGHGGTYRSYGGTGTTTHLSTAAKGGHAPVTTTQPYVAPHAPTTTSQGHFGGHYGGGAHGGGGGHR